MITIKKCRLKCNRAIYHPELGYYLGTARAEKAKNFSHNPTQSNPAWRYAPGEGERKMMRFPIAFEGCRIVHYLKESN